MRVSLYARVSTDRGQQDPMLQIRELREYCQRRGWEIVSEYVDRMTGTKDRRPELDRLMADAHKRRFDVVIVWKFDRFARSVSHLIRALENFQALGIQFVSLSESIDTSTPAGKMVFTVLGAVAELERSLIVERVRAGLRNARAKGKRLGRPSKGIGRGQNALKMVLLPLTGLERPHASFWAARSPKSGVVPAQSGVLPAPKLFVARNATLMLLNTSVHPQGERNGERRGEPRLSWGVHLGFRSVRDRNGGRRRKRSRNRRCAEAAPGRTPGGEPLR